MTRLHLALALARCAGRVVTKELAAQILAEVCPHEDRSYPIHTLPPGAWQDYSFRAERIAGQEAELLPLHQVYQRDTRGTVTGDANYEFARLREDERGGKVVLFAARRAGELAALLRTRLWRDLESQRLMACDDMLVVKPEHRGSMLPIRLCGYVERTLFDAGVQEITVDTLSINGAERIAHFFGYTPVATKFHKVAQEACNFSQASKRRRKGVEHEPLAPH
jgi:hypothetical protein